MKQYDFTQGERGKFYRENATFKLPVYLEVEVETYLTQKAAHKGVELFDLVNQMIASYEVGRRRVPISMLPTLAIALAATMEDLVAQPTKPGKRGPAPKLQQQMERISQQSWAGESEQRGKWIFCPMRR